MTEEKSSTPKCSDCRFCHITEGYYSRGFVSVLDTAHTCHNPKLQSWLENEASNVRHLNPDEIKHHCSVVRHRDYLCGTDGIWFESGPAIYSHRYSRFEVFMNRLFGL